MIGLDQLGDTLRGTGAAKTSLYLHTHKMGAAASAADQRLSKTMADVNDASVLAAGRALGDGEIMPVASSSVAGLPPSPVVAFQESGKADGAGMGVLAGYDAHYASPVYHSRFDTYDNPSFSATGICQAATLAARTAYALATNKSSSAGAALAVANVPSLCLGGGGLVRELIACFEQGFNCSIAARLGYTNQRYIAKPPVITPRPAALYSSVYRSNAVSGGERRGGEAGGNDCGAVWLCDCVTV